MIKQTLLAISLLSVSVSAFVVTDLVAAEGHGLSKTEQGKKLAFTRSKGNCLACHYIEGGELMGNYGPPLLAMKARFPDREVLREQIWDAAVKNPDTRMPPFGRNHILSEEEIDLVTDFIHTL